MEWRRLTIGKYDANCSYRPCKFSFGFGQKLKLFTFPILFNFQFRAVFVLSWQIVMFFILCTHLHFTILFIITRYIIDKTVNIMILSSLQLFSRTLGTDPSEWCLVIPLLSPICVVNRPSYIQHHHSHYMSRSRLQRVASALFVIT